MGKRITDRSFFTKPAEEVAKNLIGKIICHSISEDNIIRFRLIETEAYGKNDSACHSNKYKSGNGVESQKMIGGTIYVHVNNKDGSGSMFDIVANKENIGEGVLIRGGINIDNPSEIYESAPILLGRALQINYKSLNQSDLLTSKEIWIEDDGFISKDKITENKRKGLEDTEGVTEKDKNRKWRFDLELNK